MKALYIRTKPGGILLKKIKRWPTVRRHLVGRQVRIWSGEWDAWWRPCGHGYTTDILQAGIFEFEDAEQQSHHAGPEKRIEYVPI